MAPLRILVQTSIAFSADDWHAGRFSSLVETLRSVSDGEGRPAEVVVRDRSPDATGADPVLARLDRGRFDQVWLLGVDGGQGPSDAECAAIDAFQRSGGGVLTARDHQNMGLWLRKLRGVGAAHYFHDQTCREPDPTRWTRDDADTRTIDFPNYHSGANGDYQRLSTTTPLHPVLLRESGEPIEFLPSHPHEGAVAPPPGDRRARAIAHGRSTVTRQPFHLVVVFERGEEFLGRGVAESSFHHFADYNWDPRSGAPSFVTEPPGSGLQDHPRALEDAKVYIRNLATWLAPPECRLGGL